MDPETRRAVPELTVGEIWVGGPSVASGYWNGAEATAATFRTAVAADTDERAAQWLRTGDLGFLRDGMLFITGRRRDRVIVRGECHYPQDIEQTAERASARIRRGVSVAFGWDDGSRERVALVLEAARDLVDGDAPAFREVIDAVREAVSAEHGIALATVLLVPPGAVPKTSSGKVKRRACREAALAGTLEILACDGSTDLARRV